MPYPSIVNMLDIGYIDQMPKPTAYPIKKLVFLTTEQADAVREYRFDARVQSENEAIRQLIQLGLEASKIARKQTN